MQTPQQGPTLSQQLAFVQSLMKFPALTVMVFLRRDLGYRMLNPLWLIGVTGFLVVLTVLAAPGNEDARPMDLLLFALAALILGVYQRVRRWFQFNRNARQHSFYIGTSPFDFHWLPMFIRRNRRIARFIDPFFCLGVGVALFPFSRALSCWLVFSSFCLRSMEYLVHCKERNLNLDALDGLIMSEIRGQNVEQFEEASDAGQHRPAQGIPTGIGQDIKQHIKRRKAK